MAFNLKNRSFLKEIDFQPRELGYLLKLSEALKLAKYAGTEVKHLEGKEIALIFEKTSTRTRSAFEVGASDQGAHVTYLDPSGSQLGHKESIAGAATAGPRESGPGAEAIRTAVSVPMGEPKAVCADRVKLLTPYQLNSALLKASGNPAVKFMHSLPASHGPNTTVAPEMMEHTGM